MLSSAPLALPPLIATVLIGLKTAALPTIANAHSRSQSNVDQLLDWPTSISRSTAHIPGCDSSVGITTRCGLGGGGSNPDGEIFRTRSDGPWGPPSLLCNGYRVCLPGVKRPERGVYHPPLSSDEVKERVELYLYSPSGPSWPVQGWTLSLPYCACPVFSLVKSSHLKLHVCR